MFYKNETSEELTAVRGIFERTIKPGEMAFMSSIDEKKCKDLDRFSKVSNEEYEEFRKDNYKKINQEIKKSEKKLIIKTDDTVKESDNKVEKLESAPVKKKRTYTKRKKSEPESEG